MISTDDVKKLAALSRLSLTDEEIKKLQGEITAILGYIDTIQKVTLPETPSGSAHLEIENIMRDDINPHEPGIHSGKLLAQAPKRDGDYLKVKKIL